MNSISRQYLRRYIRKVLTGICLGTGLVAAPVYAKTFIVTNANDSGPGSLRQAILDVNAMPTEYHFIESDPSVKNEVLTLESTLPAITGKAEVFVDFANGHLATPITVLGDGILRTHIRVDNSLTINDNAQVDWFNSVVGILEDRDLTIATINDYSYLSLLSMSMRGDVVVNNNATLEWDYGTAWGDIITNDNASASITHISIVDGKLVANGNSTISFSYAEFESLGNSELEYGAIANDNAQINITSAAVRNSIQANDNSIIRVNGNWPSESAIRDNATANNQAIIYLQNASINGDATFNDASILRSSGENYVHGTTALASNAIFAPHPTNGSLNANQVILHNSALRPWFTEGDLSGSLSVGDDNPYTVLKYNDIDGTFDSKVLSPLDFAITPDSYSSGAVKLYLESNQINLNKLSGSENAHAVGGYLSKYFNSTQTPGGDLDFSALQSSGAPTRLNDITTKSIIDAANNGDLNQLDQLNWDVYSTHNTQSYWNQKSFIESISANLQNNPLYQDSGKATENPLYKGLAGNASATNAQLSTLRQTMASSTNGLSNAINKNDGNSSQLWASYNGNHQNTDADGSVGSRDWSSSTNSYTVGFTNGGNKFSWGVAAGHQDSDLNFADGTGEQAGWNMGLYGSLQGKSTFVTGIVGYGKYDNDLYGANVSNFDTKATSASLEIGKHLGQNKNNTITPYASILWTKIKQSAALGNEGFVLKNGSNNIFTTELGVRYNHRIFDKDDSLKGGWLAGLSWLHQGGDTGLPVNVGFANVEDSVPIKGTPLAGNSARVQLGAYGRIHNNLIGFAAYQGTFGSSQKINAVNAGIGYQF